jgi:hypothetical protein
MQKQFIINEQGAIQSVIIDYESFQKFEELFEDINLGKIMELSRDDEEVSIDEAKAMLGISDGNHS